MSGIGKHLLPAEHLLRTARVIVYRAALTEVRPPENTPDGLVFRRLAAEDFRRGKVFREKGRARQFEHMAGLGHRCYGFVTAQGEPVSYLWLSAPRYGSPVALFELGLSCRIAPDTGYIWDCRTDPGFQNRGLFRAGLRRVMEIARGDGLAAAIIASEATNQSSNAAIEAAGFETNYTMTIFRFLGGIYAVAARGRVLLRGPGGAVQL